MDSYVPYAGPLADGVQTTLYKVKSSHVQLRRTLHPRAAAEGQADCGFSTSIVEGGSHDVVLKNATPNIING